MRTTFLSALLLPLIASACATKPPPEEPAPKTTRDIVQVRVVEPAGRPIPGATIESRGKLYAVDADGKATVQSYFGGIACDRGSDRRLRTVQVRADGYVALEYELHPVSRPSETIELRRQAP